MSMKARSRPVQGDPAALALHLAELKALEVSSRRDGLVLGADQVLEFEGQAYDKARSVEEASERCAMLRGGPLSERRCRAGADGEIVWRHQAPTLVMRELVRRVSRAILKTRAISSPKASAPTPMKVGRAIV
jgi:hypothetical protein